MSALVSVIIATHNRFDHLVRAIESVRAQTYKPVEIIVVDDASTDEQYKNPSFQDVTYIRLLKGTKEMFGFPCPGYVRSVGMRKASGTYLAFLDDDDIWLPTKLELQLSAMQRTGCRMSTTDAYADYEIYNPSKQYHKFYSEIDFEELQFIHRRQGSSALDTGFPEVWDRQFVETHNCCMTSSVVLHRSIVDTIGTMPTVPIGQEDWSYWKRALQHTNSVFIREPCVYYTRRRSL